ncbi:hypothetical protein DSO57_1021927 [Entomophthora muscae]|uniref:Uncharacterized protein n=1 Tax=Entomophthora muscae TaxID=34485 RepID=A0ACC2UCX9_9FUNG|nr:hypothetical protein DSO57_1021927 [Entomophthora muscae]
MFTQPKTCCGRFSLRSAALALPFIHIVADVASLGLMHLAPSFFWISSTIFIILLSIYSMSAILNIFFFVGVAKRKPSFIVTLSTFTLLRLMFNTLLHITNIILQMNHYNELEPMTFGETTQPRILIAALVASMTINYLFNLHLYFCVHGYAQQVKAPEWAK